MDLLTSDFMIRAMLAAIFTGLAAPAIGTFLVHRRLALMGDGIGHVAVTGVAVGLFTGTEPLITAVITAVLAGVLIETIRAAGRTGGDVALALLFYGGIAGGVFITGLAGLSASTLQRYLFGSIASLRPLDVWVTLALATIVIALTVVLAPRLFAVAQDPEYARVAGLNVRFYNLLVAVLAAVTVTVAMRTVGLLLVSALMVVPVAASQQVTRSFRVTLGVAMLLGAATSWGGVVISGFRDVSPGATIVLLALAVFALTWPIGALMRHRRARALPFDEHHEADEHLAVPETHPHEHGPDCGHPAVPHGDHVDYVHDGHRHAPHGEHYDEH